MSTAVTLDSLLAQARSLPQEARLELAERLWREGSYEDEIGAEQYAEVMRRVEEIKAGTANTIPGDQVWKEAEAFLASLR